MFEFLHKESFRIFANFVVGVAAMVVLKPVCKGADCIRQRAPSPEQVKNTTYQIGSKCYQFTPTAVECPAAGAPPAVEPFQAQPSRNWREIS